VELESKNHLRSRYGAVAQAGMLTNDQRNRVTLNIGDCVTPQLKDHARTNQMSSRPKIGLPPLDF